MLDINIIESIVKNVSNKCVLPFLHQVQVHEKQDGSLITQVDLTVQKHIQTQLKQHFPEYGFFAEELSQKEMDQFFTKNNQGFWCLDPLDGTSNYTNSLPFFAISLALIVDGKTVFGIVYDPMRDECFTAIRGEGAYCNSHPVKPETQLQSHEHSELNQCMAMIDFKRLPSELRVKLISEHPFRSLRSFGAAALEWCWLAMGRCHIYLHGKHMLWDYAAGQLIAHEAGCYSCDFHGNEVFEITQKPRTVVAATNKSLHKQWFDYISG